MHRKRHSALVPQLRARLARREELSPVSRPTLDHLLHAGISVIIADTGAEDFSDLALAAGVSVFRRVMASCDDAGHRHSSNM